MGELTRKPRATHPAFDTSCSVQREASRFARTGQVKCPMPGWVGSRNAARPPTSRSRSVGAIAAVTPGSALCVVGRRVPRDGVGMDAA